MGPGHLRPNLANALVAGILRRRFPREHSRMVPDPPATGGESPANDGIQIMSYNVWEMESSDEPCGCVIKLRYNIGHVCTNSLVYL